MDLLECPYRLYVTTIDAAGRERSEGPYTFPTAGEAVGWIRQQTHVSIVEAALYVGDELVVRQDARKAPPPL